MTVYSKAVTQSGIGKSAGTFDDIGSITLRPDAGHLYGLLVAYAPSAIVVNEAGSPVLRINSKSLGYTNEDFLLSQGVGDPIATNDSQRCIRYEFIPLTPAKEGTLGNAKIELGLSATKTTTNGWTIVVAAIHSKKFDEEYAQLLRAWQHRAAIGGAYTTGTASSTSATKLGDISVPAHPSEIVAVQGIVLPEDETAGEEVVGYIEFVSSIPDFGPQEWPLPAITPSLGTAVGAPPIVESKPIPVKIPLPTVEQTITANAILAAALANPVTIGAGVRYR